MGSCQRIFGAIIISLIATGQLISQSCNPIQVVAHRGVSSLAPENTLPAFELGIELNVDYVEFDVQKSLDDSLMIIHDATVDGTTQSSGLVSSFSYQQLKQMDAGSWYSAEFIGTEIPTLYEVMNLLKGKSKMCIELKAANIETQAVQLIETMGLVDEVIVESFDYPQLQTVRSLNPSIKLCYLTSVLTQTKINEAIALNIEVIGSGGNPDIWLVKSAQNAGLEVWNYTINNGSTLLNRISKGLDGIFTDNPQDLIGLKSYCINGGLIANWNFDENSGLIINDESANSNHLYGTINWDSGVFNSGITFNGVSDSISIPQSNSLNISGNMVTVSAWLNLSMLPSQIPYPYGPIFDSDEDSYILYLDKNNQELRFKITDDLGLIARAGIPENLLQINTWFHIAGVYNGTEVFIYLNGELIDVAITTGIGDLKPNQQAYFGFNNGNYFNGKIDEFKIFERCLAPIEIQNDFGLIADNCEFDQIVFLPYENFFIPFPDSSMCENEELNITYNAPEVIYKFNGMDYINANNVIKEIHNSSHSFFSWIKTTNPTQDERIFAINDRFGNNNFLLGVYNGTLDLYTNGNYFSTSINIADNDWHHVGYSWNQLTQELKLFVDGQEELNSNLDLTIESTDRASIGQEFDQYQCSNYFYGHLSNISIWKNIINPSSIMYQTIIPDSNLICYFRSINTCESFIQDYSIYENHGYSCKSIDFYIDTIPNYASIFYINWVNEINQEEISNDVNLSILISDNMLLSYEHNLGNIILTDTININSTPVNPISWPSDTLFCEGEVVEFNPGIYSGYFWTGGVSDSIYNLTLNGTGFQSIGLQVIDNSGCTTSDEFIFEVVNCENEFTIYPNPTIIGDKIRINLPSDFNSNQISIHDEVGRLIISLSVFQNQITWDGKNEMHSLVSTGIYYITIVNTITNKKYVGKLILV
jgi:glycerophosphoryl diester phosphodiesterase